ncbi:MAG: DUF6550 family protein [Clostridia bacterium]
MNKGTNGKLIAAIVVVLAILLIGGSHSYVKSMQKQDTIDVDITAGVEENELEDIVVDVQLDDIVVESPQEETLEETNEPENVQDDEVEIEVTEPVIEETYKPETKEDAVAPEDDTPPTVDENGVEETKVVEPNKTSEPQNGDTREDGSIYVNGFGWVENKGPNKVIYAPNAGTGEIIGQMG